MQPIEFLQILHVAEKLKCNTRHSYTSSGRHESVAEHSWRISLMAMLIGEEFPEADMNKVIRMCLIHDQGEAFTGDIPAFDKTRRRRGKGGCSLRCLGADAAGEYEKRVFFTACGNECHADVGSENI